MAGMRAVMMDVGTNSGVHLSSAVPFCDGVNGFEPWVRGLRHEDVPGLAGGRRFLPFYLRQFIDYENKYSG